jgi:hypothetical protein
VHDAAPRPTATCPRCGAEAPPAASTCRGCGFGFYAAERRPRLPRPRPAPFAVGAAVVAAVLAAVLLAGRDAETSPVSARSAERQLEDRLISLPDDDTAGVRCPRRIEPRQTVRCNVLHPSGNVQLILVTLSPAGELEVDVP